MSNLGIDPRYPPALPDGFRAYWCSWCARWIGLADDDPSAAYVEHMDACQPPEHITAPMRCLDCDGAGMHHVVADEWVWCETCNGDGTNPEVSS